MNTPTKRCTKCGQELAATTQNFYAKKDGKYGIRAICIACTLAHETLRRQTPERQDYVKQYRIDHRRSHIEYMKDYNAILENKERKKESTRKSHNKPEVKARQKKYLYGYYRMPEYKARERERNKVRRPQLRIYQREYKRLHGSVFHQRRKALENSLPNTLTRADWQYCCQWFNNKCAICDCNDKLTIDHWIPITNPECPGNIPANVIPLCKSCNSSKNDTPAYQWLSAIWGDRAKEILDRVEAYFAQVTSFK